ncbi:hypothetical protein [Pseudoalteromonas denitrificans]|uniref:Activator of Hsp90 ATPase homolog 1-like protein n=1 Tax=Pseudoalteromonas denitrificans DSM 6059 TaxID=1123010 RepID=A0A1I1TJS7_9GAMM|nr:hypothetical protein [Pseudoalteromonas denitrificans]SFD57428.1 hypothetical protein SAMN02745724_04878 [Pseudoalteromonas denitrificans DSM 6059]
MNKLNLKKHQVFACTLVFVSSFASQAEITSQSDSSFTVTHSFVSNKSISTARHEFGHVGRWWTSEFTLSGKGNNMYFNSKGMHERMPSGETITHLIKTEKADNQWTWAGTLGKLKNEKVNGEMKISIKERHHQTKITMKYTVTSDLLVSNQNWPSYIDNMLSVQMNSLKKSLNNR